MIDAGASLVVGGHPHVTQDIEYYQGKLIVYSLGNFVFDGFDLPAARTGWLLRLTLDRDGLVSWDTVAAQIDEDGTVRTRTLTPAIWEPHALRPQWQTCTQGLMWARRNGF
jgi:poly-gamma-glutamate capsule biosynthesis protein CapA/YwtB (metallophosphatase superfamily)